MWVLVFKYFFKPHAISAKQCRNTLHSTFAGSEVKSHGREGPPKWSPSELSTSDAATWSNLQYTQHFWAFPEQSQVNDLQQRERAEAWVCYRGSPGSRERESLSSQVGCIRLCSSLKLETQQVCTWKKERRYFSGYCSSRFCYDWRGCRNSASVSLHPWLTQKWIQSLGKGHFRG